MEVCPMMDFQGRVRPGSRPEPDGRRNFHKIFLSAELFATNFPHYQVSRLLQGGWTMKRILLITFVAVLTMGCNSAPADAAGGSGAASAASAANSVPGAWVRYYDPSEHSFSMEVPQGWQVQ